MRFKVKHKPLQQVGAKRYIMKLAWWPTRVKQYDTDIEYDVWLEYYQSHEELVRSDKDRWDGSTYLYWRVIDKRI
jgi:hypothetical protein